MNITTRLAAGAALVAVTWAGAAAAQEFKGAEVSGEILSFSDDDDTLGPSGHAEWQAFVRDSEDNTVGLVEWRTG